MIDLTPLEVRKKKGDFRRAMRGYDPALVDDFLDLVADRLEEVVRDNLALQERAARQEEQVRDYRDRERALTEALVSAQEMREDVRRQAAREAELATRAAEQHAEQLRAKAEEEVRLLRSNAQHEASQALATIQHEHQRLEEGVLLLRARQQEFLSSYRSFLEQELAELGVIARAAGVSERAANARNARAAEVDARAAEVDARAAEGARNPSAGAETPAHTTGVAPAAAAGFVAGAVATPAEPPAPATRDHVDADGVAAVEPDADLADDADADEEAFTLDADPLAASTVEGGTAPDDDDEEPFAPEPFVEDETDAIIEAYEAEAVSEQPTASADETDVSGDGSELLLYDGIANDDDGDGVPGPIGLGESEPWSSAPEWSIADLQLIDGSGGDDIDLDDEDDEEMQTLLRNAAAAGYRLDDEVSDELLLDDAVSDDAAVPDEPANDSWLPTLLEDDK